jgi:hypothetical protein
MTLASRSIALALLSGSLLMPAILQPILLPSAWAEAPLPTDSGYAFGGAAQLEPYNANSGGGMVLSSSSTTTPQGGLANRVYTVNAGTVVLQRGKVLRLRVLNGVSSTYAREGEAFAAYVDETIFGPQGQTVIPQGSLLRGRLQDVSKSRFFGKGGSFRMAFDNVTLPNGEILPIDLQLASVNQQDDLVKNDGRVYEDPGYADKFSRTLDKSGYILSDITRSGYEAGVDTGGKALGAVTGTFSAIGGAVAAAGYTVGKSVYHAVAKGEPADLSKDDALYTQLMQDAQIPVL